MRNKKLMRIAPIGALYCTDCIAPIGAIQWPNLHSINIDQCWSTFLWLNQVVNIGRIYTQSILINIDNTEINIDQCWSTWVNGRIYTQSILINIDNTNINIDQCWSTWVNIDQSEMLQNIEATMPECRSILTQKCWSTWNSKARAHTTVSKMQASRSCSHAPLP